MKLDLLKLHIMLLADGGIVKRERTYKIYLTNNSEILQEMFKECAKRAFGINHFITDVSRGSPQIIFHSKSAAKKLFKLSPTYRTSKYSDGTIPPAKLTSQLFKLPVKEQRELLKLLFSLEGSISVAFQQRKNKTQMLPRIKLGCTHLKLRKQLCRWLRKLGFHPTEEKEGIYLRKLADIKKFAREIKFIDGVKVCGKARFFKGMEKNELLFAILRVLRENKDSLMFNLSKEELILLIKKLTHG